MFNRYRTVVSIFCGTALSLLLADGRAQFTFASDNADNYGGAGEPGWTNNANGGSGWNAWTLSAQTGATNSLGDPSQSGISTADLGSSAFGMRATQSGNSARISRTLTTGMGIGDSLSFYWGVNWDTDGGGNNKGFDLRSGTNQILNVNMAGFPGNITVNSTNTGFAYGTNAILVTLQRTLGGYTFLMTPRDGVGASYTSNITTTLAIDTFAGFAANANSAVNRDIFFDNFTNANSGVFTSGGTVTNGNAFSGSGNLSVGNNTILALSGAATYSGTTTISNGSTLRLQSSSAFTLGSEINGTGAVAVSNGIGRVTLTGNNAGFSGGVTLINGTLRVGHTNAVGSGVLSFNGGTFTAAGAAALSLTNSITLGGNVTFGDNVGTGDLLLGGSLALGGATRTLSVANTTTLAGVIGGGAGVGLIKAGSGSLVLAASNSYTGSTTISGGALLFTDLGALSANAVINLSASGTTLDISGLGAEGSTNGSLAGVSGSAVNLGGKNLDVGGNNSSTTFAGVISNVGSLTKSGTGTFTVTGANTYSGGTLVSAGVLAGTSAGLQGSITNNATVVFDQLSDGTYAGSMSGSGALHKLGSGVLSLASDNNTYGGATMVGGGVLRITNAGNGGASSALGSGGTVVLTNGGILDYAGTTNSSTDRGINLAAGNGGIGVSNSAAALTLNGVISNTGTLVKSGAGTLILAATNIYTGGTFVTGGTLGLISANSLPDAGMVTVNGPSAVIASGTDLFVGNSGAGRQVIVTNGGTLRSIGGRIGNNVSASNNSTTVTGSGSTWTNSGELYIGYNGGGNNLVVSNGGRVVSAGGHLGVASAGNLAYVTGAGSLWTNSGSLQLGVSGNLLLITNGGVVANTDGYIGLGSGTNTVTVTGSGSRWTNTAGVYVGYSGRGNQLIVSNGGAVFSASGFVGSGAGDNAAFVVGAGSLWTNHGTLAVGIAGTNNSLTVYNGGVAAASAMVIASESGAAGALNIGRFGFSDTAGMINAQTISFGAGSGAINFNQNNSVSLTAAISGAGSISQLGSGVTSLAGSNTYSGATTVGGGVMRASVLSDFGLASSIGTNGTITLTNGGVLEYSGTTNSSFNRGINLSAGEGGIGVSSSGVALTMSGVISNTGSLLKTGEGTLILSATSTFGGSAIVSAGTLSISGSGALPSLAAISLSSGSAIFDISGVAVAGSTNGSLGGVAGSSVNLGGKNLTVGGNDANSTFGGVISGAGSLTKTGAGAMYLTGQNLHAGGTIVTQGALALEVENALPDGRMLTVTGSNSVLTSGTYLSIGGTASDSLLLVTNGAVVFVAGSGYVGYDISAANNAATVTGEGSSWTNAGHLFVGYAGRGNRLDISDGASVVADWSGYIGSDSTSASNTLTVSGAGSRFSTGGELTVGNDGSGNRMVVDGGAAVQNTWSGFIGYGGSSNSVVVSGGSSLWTNGGEVYIGYYGTDNSLTISDGGVVAADYGVYIASQFESSGALNFGRFGANDSAGSLVAPSIVFGDGEGVVNFNQTNATVVAAAISGSGAVRQLGSGNTILLAENTYTGATLILGGALKIGDGGTSGTLGSGAVTNEALLIVDRADDIQLDNIISGAGAVTKLGHGTLTITGTNDYGGGFSLVSGAVRAQSGGAFGSGFVTQANAGSRLIIDTTEEVTNQMSVFHLQSWQTVTLSGSKTMNNATYDVTNNTITTESGNLSGVGGVIKLGAGALILSGSNSYTGAVDVQAGMLDLSSTTGPAAGSASSITVAADAVLLISQSSQVNDSAAVTLSGGTIRRGPGVSEIFGNLNMTAASTMDFGLGTGGNFRFQTYANTGSALVTVQNFLPGNSMQFLTNSFSAANLAQFGFGESAYNTSIQGNYFTITAIPEASAWIAAVGLLGLLACSARRRRHT